MDQAFSCMRAHARNRNLGLVRVAHDVIAGTLAPGFLDDATPPAPPNGAARTSAPLAEAVAGLAGMEPVLALVDPSAPVDAVEAVVSEIASMFGAEQVTFLIADLSGDTLIRFVRPDLQGPGGSSSARQRLEKVALAGTPYQRALISQQVQIVPDGDRYRLFAPVADRGDALGVLELVLERRPDDALAARVASAAHALAYVVIADRRHTDLFESVQRNAPFSLAAEIQRRLLPPAYTCEVDRFTFAGWLEPASHVGGDSFDYSVDRDVLHVSMTDAMGRGVEAAQLATLVLGSLRNSRRADVGPAEQARRANEAMVSHADGDTFVTGLLLRADLRSGQVIAVNAGHPRPYLLRNGRVRCLELDADMPFGMMADSSYREQKLLLESGDRLVLVTDGLLERNEIADHLNVAEAIVATAGLHPREVVHVFKASVLAARAARFDDDAAILCIDWHEAPPPGGGIRR